MSDELLDPQERESGGLSRRRLIQGAAAAGAAAWVAPVIIDSLASPAAATTLLAGTYCLAVTATGDGTKAGDFVDAFEGSACTTNPCPGGSTTVEPGTPLSDYCVTVSPSPPWLKKATVTFTISNACNCVFTSGTGAVDKPGMGGSSQCVNGLVSAGGKVITFVVQGSAQTAVGFRLVLTCT